jgi:matrixin/uncharacterized protein DUF5648
MTSRQQIVGATVICSLAAALGHFGGIARAYTLMGDPCVSNSIPFYVNPGFVGSQVGSAQDQVNAIVAGASQWYSQSLSPKHFDYLGTTSITVISPDGINAAFVRYDQPADAVAETSRWTAFGECQFDVVYHNGWGFSVIAYGNGYDLQSVSAHEFGHGAGLDHSQTTNAIMYFQAQYGVPYGRSLFHDDVDGIEWRYGWRFGNGYHDEGVSAYLWDNDGGGIRRRMDRLYRGGGTEDHFLSSDPVEISNAISLGYSNDGPVGYVYANPDSPSYVAYYRLYKAGHHLSTAQSAERDAAIADGWTLEGVSGYVMNNPGEPSMHAVNRLHNVRYGDHLYQ